MAIVTEKTVSFPCKCKMLKNKTCDMEKCTCSHVTQKLCKNTFVSDGHFMCMSVGTELPDKYIPKCMHYRNTTHNGHRVNICLRTKEYDVA